MKPLIYTLIFCTALYSAESVSTPTIQPQPQQDKELAWVDEQIQAILPARVGIPDTLINSLSDPMKLKKPAPKEGKTGSLLLPPPRLGGIVCPTPPKIIEEPLRLKAVMNQSALINGKWYKLNDSVRGQTLSEIKINSVVLTNNKNQKMVLFLLKDNKNVKITTK